MGFSTSTFHAAFNAGMMGSLVPKAGLLRGLWLRMRGEPLGEADLAMEADVPRGTWSSPHLGKPDNVYVGNTLKMFPADLLDG